VAQTTVTAGLPTLAESGSSGHAMRLNSQTGVEGSHMDSLNCDRSLHSGLRVPEVVMSVDCQN